MRLFHCLVCIDERGVETVMSLRASRFEQRYVITKELVIYLFTFAVTEREIIYLSTTTS